MDNYGIRLRLEKKAELAQRALPAETLNEYGETFAVTKTEAGASFPASAYAYVPDAEKPSTWKLRLWATPGGGPDAHIVGAAIAALGPGGFRGQKVQIPDADLPGVKAKVKAAWTKANPDKKPGDMPSFVVEIEEDEGAGIESEEFGMLPPALAAQIVKKLTADLAKETDPAKKAAIQAKIDKFSK